MHARSRLFVVVLLGAVALGGMVGANAASAQSAQPGPSGPDYGGENPKELFEGATRMAMKALELLIRTLPQYEPPVVLDNGDILIRRKPALPPSSPPDDAPGADAHRI